jgi:hypothetical protein
MPYDRAAGSSHIGGHFDGTAHRGDHQCDSLHEAISRAASLVPQRLEQYQVDSTWMEMVHEALYRDIASLSFDQISQRHPYLTALGRLVCRTDLTVNFNFDDLVDEAAINFARDRNKEQPEIISRAKIETRRDASVIYHINGYLPREARRRRSEGLVFTEDAFADVLISPTLQESDFLMSRFATTTFLLLGTSLNDNSLKNMLRAGMKRSPANHHYIVYWEDPVSPRRRAEAHLRSQSGSLQSYFNFPQHAANRRDDKSSQRRGYDSF